MPAKKKVKAKSKSAKTKGKNKKAPLRTARRHRTTKINTKQQPAQIIPAA